MMARARIGQRPPALRWSLPSLTEFIVYYQVLGFMKASVTHMTRYTSAEVDSVRQTTS